LSVEALEHALSDLSELDGVLLECVGILFEVKGGKPSAHIHQGKDNSSDLGGA
jgi:hypothetical protein